eukprot:1424552-Ditylum_brightwellii.AAC.1
MARTLSGVDNGDVPLESPMKAIQGILSTIPGHLASAAKATPRSRITKYNTPTAALALREKKITIPKGDSISGSSIVINKNIIAKQVENRLGERSYQNRPLGNVEATPIRENSSQKLGNDRVSISTAFDQRGESSVYMKHTMSHAERLSEESPPHLNRRHIISDAQYRSKREESGGSDTFLSEDEREDEDDLLDENETIDET